MSEPTTRAGRWLAAKSNWDAGMRGFFVRINLTAGPEDMLVHVLAIEAEARQQERERIAAAAAPRPEGLDVDELIGKVSVLLDGPSDAAVRRAVVRVIIGWARLSDTGDTPDGAS